MIVGDSCVHFFIIRKNEMRCSLLFKFLVKILKKSLFIMSQFILLISNRVSVIILVQKMLHFSFCDIFLLSFENGTKYRSISLSSIWQYFNLMRVQEEKEFYLRCVFSARWISNVAAIKRINLRTLWDYKKTKI